MDAISLCGAPRYMMFVAEIHKWIKHVRESVARATQEVFAAKIGVDRVTVANWERSKYVPELENVQAIVAAYPGAPPPPGFAEPADGAHALVPKTIEAREIAFMVDNLTKPQREYARDMVTRTFGQPRPHAPTQKRPGSKPGGAKH